MASPYIANLLGKAGKAIDVIGNYGGFASPVIGTVSALTPDLNFSERLQSYGGTYGTSQNYAAAPTNQQTQAPTSTTQKLPPVADISNATKALGGSVLGTQDTAGGNNVVSDASAAIDKYKQAIDASRMSDSELSSLFDPQFASLNAAEALTQENRNQALSNLDQQFGINRDQLESQVNQTNAELTAQGESANKRALASEAAARRLYNELSQANQQRFGGSSSAGQAASELQGREFQRNRGDIKSALEDTIRTIDEQKFKVQEDYTNAIKELQFNVQNAKMQIEQQFNDAILNISNNRNMLESQRREARLNELTSYRDQIKQLQFQAIDFEQQLRSNAQAASQTLDQQLMEQARALGISSDQLMSQYESSPLAFNTGYGVTDPGTINDAQLTGNVTDEELLNSTGIRTAKEQDALTPLTELQGLTFAN